MAYEKRVCVLKQIKKGFSADGNALTGAVYAERLGGELTVTAKIAGIAPVNEGRYCLALWIDGKIICLEYKTCMKVADAPSLNRGFSALLCFVRGEAEPVAYGGCGEAPHEFQRLLSAVNGEQTEGAADKKRKRPIPQPVPPVQTPGVSPNVPLAPTVPLPGPIPDESETTDKSETAYGEDAKACFFRTEYNDEAIASDDYFAFAQSDEDDGSSHHGKKETSAQDKGGDPAKDASSAFVPPRGSLTYYHEVKEKLDEVFAKFPRDERLKAIFPMSDWVNSEGALLGVIYEDGVPRYLCVAVEAMEEPPEEIKERGVFVPRTQFSDKEGFYVVFQDADTGEYVRVYDA